MKQDNELSIRQLQDEGAPFVKEFLYPIFDKIAKGDFTDTSYTISKAFHLNIVSDYAVFEDDSFVQEVRKYRFLVYKLDKVFGPVGCLDFVRGFLDYVCRDFSSAHSHFLNSLNEWGDLGLKRFFIASCLHHLVNDVEFHPRNFYLKAQIVSPYEKQQREWFHSKHEFVKNALSAYFINYRSVRAYELVFKYSLEELIGASLPKSSVVKALEKKMPNVEELYHSLMLKVEAVFFRKTKGSEIVININPDSDQLDFIVEEIEDFENGTSDYSKEEIQQLIDGVLIPYSLKKDVNNNYFSWYHKHLKYQFREEPEPIDNSNEFPDAPTTCDACGSAPCMCSDPENTSTTYRG